MHSETLAVSSPPAGHKPHGPRYDPVAARMGMWLFLFTELLLFGGLFLLFSMYFHDYAKDFHDAGLNLNRAMGTVNTVALITSSLLVALSVGAIQRGRSAQSRRYLAGALLLALLFLCIKYVEWSTKIHHGLYPGAKEYLELPVGQMTFFNLYYLMTGLHALHVIIGGVILAVAMRRMGKGLITKERYVFAENAGLYWHLVDLIWIYLFPLFYLAV